MSLSDTFETRALQWIFSTTAVTRPTAWHVGLFTTAPSDAGGGTEVTGGSYARQSVGASGLTVSGNLATNGAVIEFPAATANWGTITHAAIFDAPTGGNLIAHGALAASRVINSGDIFRFPAGDIDFTLD